MSVDQIVDRHQPPVGRAPDPEWQRHARAEDAQGGVVETRRRRVPVTAQREHRLPHAGADGRQTENLGNA